MLLPMLFAAGVALADTVPDAVPERFASTVSTAPGTAARAGAVIVHRQPALPIVALRLSLLTTDPSGYAGAGLLIQHLVFPSLRDQARRVGARVQMQRTSDAMVYTIVGPASEMYYLARVLRSALEPPRAGTGELLGARHALREARLAEWEIARGHVRAALRGSLFPDDLSAAGTEASMERLDAASLPLVWSQMYRPERVMITAVGDVRMGLVQEAFADLPPLPSRRPQAERVDTVPAVPLAPAEATRGWLGLGYSASDVDPHALTVAARLLGDLLRERIPTASVEAEHWWTHHGQALAVVLAVPEPNLPAARRTLGTALATLQQNLSEERVRAAATAARREMLFYARTPERMAEVLGSFADRDGDAEAAQRFYTQLEQVSLAEVRRVLEQLTARTPARVDIPPQVPARRT
ncbi:MAG TPA: hypothetical protein VGR27_11460 [Longimicrobiaceae bacterium]|nr:hypothetical protein [Longimicrobiaceae bacterium]